MNLKGKIIDLSQEIYTGMPVYPGHLKTVIFTHVSHEETQRQLGTDFSYQASGILMCDHGPTHIDSVSHLSRAADAPSVDETDGTDDSQCQANDTEHQNPIANHPAQATFGERR